MAGLHKMFSTDPKLETGGIVIDYGDFWVKIARAGGANLAFEQTLARLMRPHRRAQQVNALPRQVQDRITARALAETVVLDWGGNIKDPEAPDDPKEFPFSVDNCIKLFEAYPDFMEDLGRQALNQTLFQQEETEQVAGKSPTTSGTG